MTLTELPAELLEIVFRECSLSSIGHLRSVSRVVREVGASNLVEQLACRKACEELRSKMRSKACTRDVMERRAHEVFVRAAAAEELKHRACELVRYYKDGHPDEDDGHPNKLVSKALYANLRDVNLFINDRSKNCEALSEGSETYEYELEGDGDDDRLLFSGEAQLTFGFLTTFDDLKEEIYVGRRWYADETLLSQELSEKPYEGKEFYTEIHCYDDLSDGNIWLGNSEGISYNYDGPRPPGVKAFKGPFLKYFMPHALEDLLKRAGLSDLNVEIACTGFFDHAGDDITVGVNLACFNSRAFDLYHATRVRFCDPDTAQGDGIVDVSSGFLESITRSVNIWNPEERTEKTLDYLREKLDALSELLPSIFGFDETELRLVFNGAS